jgi:Holliday junction resolvase RusA-like endonuclease
MPWVEMGKMKIPGEPRGKGRPRFVRATGRTYTPKETLSYEDRIYMIADIVFDEYELPLGRHVPVRLDIEAVFTRPKRLFRKADPDARIHAPQTRVDADNIAKTVGDALQRLIFVDDRQVVEIRVTKHYGAILDRKEKTAELSHVLVTVYRLGEQ